MKKEENIREELREVAPLLLDLSSSMPFSLPKAQSETQKLELPFVISPITQAPFTVPPLYFSKFERQIMEVVKQGPTNVSSDILDHISKSMPYHLPNGYFENLKVAKNAELKALEAPLIQLNRKGKAIRIAAVIILMLGTFSVWKFLPQLQAGMQNKNLAFQSEHQWQQELENEINLMPSDPFSESEESQPSNANAISQDALDVYISAYEKEDLNLSEFSEADMQQDVQNLVLGSSM